MYLLIFKRKTERFSVFLSVQTLAGPSRWTLLLHFFPPNVLKMNVCDTDSWTCKDTPPHTVWRMSCLTPQASGLGRAPETNSISRWKWETFHLF